MAMPQITVAALAARAGPTPTTRRVGTPRERRAARYIWREFTSSGLTCERELYALVTDYVDQSIERDEPAAIVRIGADLAKRRSRRHA